MARNPGTTDWTMPAQGAFTITAGAGALSTPIRGLYVGVSGNVTVTHMDGTSVQYTNIAAGVVHPIAATHVTAATATGIVGVY
jgi:hypothetical protein